METPVRPGGDAETLACITGGITEAFYGPVSPDIRQKVRDILTPELWGITKAFCSEYWPSRNEDKTN